MYHTAIHSYRLFESPRSVVFVVTDELGKQSEQATVTIVFNPIDDNPLLDLNGPVEVGNDYTTYYTEDSSLPITVS